MISQNFADFNEFSESFDTLDFKKFPKKNMIFFFCQILHKNIKKIMLVFSHGLAQFQTQNIAISLIKNCSH